MLLSTLSQKTAFAPAALKAVIGAMTSVAPRVAAGQFLRAAVAVCEPQTQVDAWSENVTKNLLKLVYVWPRTKVAFSGTDPLDFSIGM